MVNLRMKVKCTVCNKMLEVQNQSGEFNGEVGRFECDHFSGSIILETKIGWLLGTNAEVKYHLNMRCLRCNEENIFSVSGTGLANKSDFKLAQFCHLSHYLNIEFEQDSMVSGVIDKVSGIKSMFWS